MTNTIVEVVRLIVFIAVCLYLWRLAGREGIRRDWGWPYIFSALAFLTIGLALSLTEDFPSLGRFVVIGNTPYETLVKNIFAFLTGIVLLAVGIGKMIPATAALKATQQALKEAHGQLEEQVEQRTEELWHTNRILQKEIHERKVAQGELERAREDLEYRIAVRTADLEKTNESLQDQISERKKTVEALKESEERYRRLVDLLPIGVGIHSEGRIVFLNPAAAKTYGAHNPDELIGKPVLDTIHPDDKETTVRRVATMLQEWKPAPKAEIKFMKADGSVREAEVHSSPIMQEGKPAVIVAAIDITDRKDAEKALRESERRFKDLAELLPQFVYEFDRNGYVTFVNRAGLEMSGYTYEDLAKGLKAVDVAVPEDVKAAARDIQRVLNGETLTGRQYKFRAKDGSRIPVMTYSSPIIREARIEGIRGVAVNTTEIDAAQEQIKNDLEEKEVLLRELHHRVKNNLQVISSMVQLQTFFGEGKTVQDVCEEIDGRIQAMAIVHEHLHRSENLATIDVKDYVTGIVRPLAQYSGHEGAVIDVDVDVIDSVCTIDTAIPCGLILNELVGNCFKHAFAERGHGRIEISLRKPKDLTYELIVRDNGVGMPDGVDIRSPGTLGLELVNSFAEQLEADVELNTEKGTEFRILFREVAKRRPKTE